MQGAGEFLGASVLSIKRAGMIASLVLMLFLLTGGYYVQVQTHLQFGWITLFLVNHITRSWFENLTSYAQQKSDVLFELEMDAAHTQIHAVVEVLVLHALRLQAATESSILRWPTFRMWEQRRLQDTAELIILRHSQLEWRLARTVVSPNHGIWLPPLCLLLPSQENQHLPSLI